MIWWLLSAIVWGVAFTLFYVQALRAIDDGLMSDGRAIVEIITLLICAGACSASITMAVRAALG